MRSALTAPGLLILAGTSMYLGAAIAVGLFAVLSPAAVAWLRISAGAGLLLLIHRPRAAAFLNSSAVVYGLFTLGMNMAFYQALDHIPMGTAVAVEFLGPVALAAWFSRNLREWLALALALGGVVALTGAQGQQDQGGNLIGIAWALLAGLLWVGYILSGSRIANTTQTQGSGISMAVGFSWASLLTLPFFVGQVAQEWDLRLFLLVLGLGFFSSVVPYSLDQAVLRLVGSGHFALLQAILPVVAAVVGALALGQWLSFMESAGIAAVVAAIVFKGFKTAQGT